MQFSWSKKAGTWLVAAAIAGGLGSSQIAFAQSAGTATVTGEVDRCNNNQTVPVAGVQVTAEGTALQARTDANGEFSLVGLRAPAVYTISVNAGSAGTSTRAGVPVQPNQLLDIGQLVLGTVFGCGDDNQAAPAAPAQPTPVPTNTPAPINTTAPTDTTTTTDVAPTQPVIDAQPVTDVQPAEPATDVSPSFDVAPVDQGSDAGGAEVPPPDEAP